MRILIVGAGRMGFSLAQRLDEERHDITMIDPDAANTERVRTRLDVMAVNGSGSSLRDLREAGAAKTDLMIAASGSDEVNIISCLLGRQLGIQKRMARVESDALLEDLDQIDQDVLGVSEFVNPARVAVNRLQHMILTPGTTESAEFADGAIVLRALRLDSGAPLTKAPLSEIHDQLAIEFRVVAVRRDEDLVVPKGDYILRADDVVYVVLRAEHLQEFLSMVRADRKRIDRVFIFGANDIGIPLAKRIEHEVDDVLLIDPDAEACDRAGAEVKKTSVIRGSALDEALMEDLKAGTAAHFVGLTESDEANLMATLLARRLGAEVGIMLTGNPDLVNLYEPLPVDAVVAPMLLSVGAFLRRVRQGRVVSLFSLGGERAEALEVEVGGNAKNAGKALRDIRFPKGVLAAAVINDAGAQVGRGDTVVNAGDRVVLFALKHACDSAMKLFSD